MAVAIQQLQAQCAFPMEGIPIYQDQYIDYTNEHSAVLADGALVHTWCGTDLDGFDRVYAQIIPQNGRPVFHDGFPPFSRPEINTVNPMVIATSDGFAILVWLEKTGEEQYTVQMQRLTVDGRRTWQEWGKFGLVFEIEPEYHCWISAFADSDVGIIIQMQNNQNIQETVWAIGPDGEVRDRWPQDGILPDTVNIRGENFADAWGGFWCRHGYPETNSFNRISAEGRRVWEMNRPLRPTDSTYMDHIGVISTGDKLFAKFEGGQNVGGITGAEISVYDSTGERTTGRTFNLQEEWGEHEFCLSWTVSASGTVALVFVPCVVGYKDELYPIDEMPWVVRYEPFAENTLPWGEHGVQLPESNDSLLFSLSPQVSIVDETILITDNHGRTDNNRVFGLNREGELAWQDQPLYFQASWGGIAMISNPDYFWVVGYFDRGYGAWQVSCQGDMPGGASPVWLSPKRRRELYNLMLAPLSPDRVGVMAMDPVRGLIGQSVTAEGSVDSDRTGLELDADYPIPDGFSDGHPWGTTGVIDGRLWEFFAIDSTNGYFAIWDGDSCISSQCSFAGEGKLSSSSNLKADNNRDQILIALKLDRIAYRLVTLNLRGERVATGIYECPALDAVIEKIEYWPDHGWVIVADLGVCKYVTLLDDSFNRLWQQRIAFPHATSATSLSDTTFTLAAVPYQNDRIKLFNARLSQSGELIDNDSILVLSAGVWAWTICRSGYDGSFWIINDHESQAPFMGQRDYHLQLLNASGRTVLGANGLNLRGRNRGDKLLVPDLDGGGWFLWEAQQGIKVLHLNRLGQSWRGLYPIEGVNVFSDSLLQLAGAVLDTSTGQVWVAAGESRQHGGGSGWSTLRMQLLDDELMDVSEPNSNLPQEFSLVAFPNPFNSTTLISFSLPQASPLSMRVFDLSGRQVATLVDGYMSAGKHSALWNASGAASGSYMVQLEAGEHRGTIPITLVK